MLIIFGRLSCIVTCDVGDYQTGTKAIDLETILQTSEMYIIKAGFTDHRSLESQYSNTSPISEHNMLKISDIHIRDPFVLPLPSEQQYYLYGTTGAEAWTPFASGVDYYTSRDLQN